MTKTEARDKAKEIVSDYLLDALMWEERLEGRGETFSPEESATLNAAVRKQVNRAMNALGYELK